MKQTLTRFIVFLIAFCLSCQVNGQCNAAALEIPGNKIDEDCDGLDDIFLHLPPYIYMVENQDFELYFHNIILSQHPQDYNFSVKTRLGGTVQGRKWAFVPPTGSAGEQPLEISVETPGGQVLATAKTMVRISPSKPPRDTVTRKLLLWGHSFFDQGYLPKYIIDRTRQRGSPPIKFVGTRRNWADPEAFHQGHGGMTWQWFATGGDSPFRFEGRINFRRYLDQAVCKGCAPDWIIIYLDINDFLNNAAIPGTSLPETDNSIVRYWDRYALPLIDSLRAAAPKTKIAICHVPPSNIRQEPFDLLYGRGMVLSDRWRWQRVVSRLLFLNTERYGGREAENFWLIPAHLDLDVVNDYSEKDPFHPLQPIGSFNAPSGYREIAKSLFAWISYIDYAERERRDSVSTATAAPEATFPVRVYPNPAQNFVQIDANTAHTVARVRIFNATGKLCHDQQGSAPVDVQQLSAGWYMVQCFDHLGHVAARRIVIER